MEFEHSLSNGIRSLFRFVCNYQLISQFLIAFVGILIAYASEAKDGLLLNSFPPEFTISDIIHPVLGFFYAGVKIPNDRDTGSSWLLIHLIFVVYDPSCLPVELPSNDCLGMLAFRQTPRTN